MSNADQVNESEIDRISFNVLRDAYIDLATVIKLAKPGSQNTIINHLEINVVGALDILSRSRGLSGNVDPVTVAVGERLRAVLDAARAPIGVDLDTLSDAFEGQWRL